MGNKPSLPDPNISKFTHFSEEDLTTWYSSFIDTYKDKMSLKDITDLFNDLFPFGNSKSFSQNLFRTLNITNESFIRFDEIMIAFSILSYGSEFERIRWLFRFYDMDSDGYISKYEMGRVMESIIEMVGPFFDGFSMNLVDEFFEIVENESGFLNFDDFKKIIERKGDAFKLLFIS